MKLQLFVICVISVFCVSYATDTCYSSVKSVCSSTGSSLPLKCNSKYGAFDNEDIMKNVQQYTQDHILKSFHYLLMSSYFGNYEANREGFEKLFRELSDDAWEKSIDLIKFITKRGGHMQFNKITNTENAYDSEKIFEFEKHELGSMAKALELQKNLARGANNIHKKILNTENHDSEVASYIENNFVHKHSDSIRKLSGYTNDLHQLISSDDASLSLYLFDEYLKNTV